MATGTDAILAAAPVTATGGVLFGDTSVAAPTDAVTALDPAWLKGGFIGEDGVVRTTDASDEDIRAWGGDTVKVVRTEHSISYVWTFLESANAEVLKLIHGEANVTVAGNKVTVKHTSHMPPRQSFVLDMSDGETKIREYIADGQLTSSGDVTFVHSDVIRYEVTLKCFPDSAGVKAVSFVDGPVTIP